MSVKKKLLIDTALILFYQQGINRVGINQVLKVSGVAKKTLYNHFSTKDELVLATLIARDELFMEWLSAQLRGVSSDKELILELFDGLTRWFNNEVPQLSPFHGCFFIHSAAEYPDKNHPVNRQCSEHKAAVRTVIEQHLNSDNQQIVDLICLLKEGAIVAASVSNDLAAADTAKAIALVNLNNCQTLSG